MKKPTVHQEIQTQSIIHGSVDDVEKVKVYEEMTGVTLKRLDGPVSSFEASMKGPDKGSVI